MPWGSWTFSGGIETGTVRDTVNGDFDRDAISLGVAYKGDKAVSARARLEYRTEDGNISGKRDTWLVKNTLGYQASPDWRFLGKLNFAISNARAGSLADADFTEIVLGYGYRPVLNDRLNMLFK